MGRGRLIAAAALAALAACDDSLIVEFGDRSPDAHYEVTTSGGVVLAQGPAVGTISVPIGPDSRLAVSQTFSGSPTSSASLTDVTTGLHPGDHVLHGAPVRTFPPLPDAPTMIVRFAEPPPGGTLLRVVTPCSADQGPGPAFRVPFYDRCTPEPPFTIDAYTVGAQGPTRHLAITVDHIRDEEVIEAGGGWGPIPTRAFTIRGLTPDLDDPLVVVTMPGGGGTLFARSVPAPGAEVVVAVPEVAFADTFDQGLAVSLSVSTHRTGRTGTRTHTVAAGARGPVTLDLAAHPIPWVNGPPVRGARGITWTEEGEGRVDYVRQLHATSAGGTGGTSTALTVIGAPRGWLDSDDAGGSITLIRCAGDVDYGSIRQRRTVCDLERGDVGATSSSDDLP